MCKNCFLLQIPEDSLDSIYDTLKQSAMISKHAGGIGISIHKIRSAGAIIKSSGGMGDGIVPMLRVFNNTARYVNQSGKRKGAFAIYLEPWHADILKFLDLRKNRGSEEERARDLNYGLWTPDLFMKRVENNEKWSLFSPDTAPGLCDVYGEEFEELYLRYEQEGRSIKSVNARDVWETILDAQTETGEPYILYKDACNKKSNQKNLGTIHSSNLCVAGDTPLLTRQGYIDIGNLRDEFVEVWNGLQWSKVQVKQTSPMASLMKVHFDDGSDLECTQQHKFYTNRGCVIAQELVIGDKLQEYTPPLVTDFDAHTSEQILRIVEKLVDGGSATIIDGQLEFRSFGKGSVMDLRKILHQIGVYPKIKTSDESIYYLIVCAQDLYYMCGLGFNPTLLPKVTLGSVSAHIGQRKISPMITSIEPYSRNAPTYCFNEPLEHKGVFNGILTGNCTEIIEYTSKDEIAVCNLSSLCLPAFVDETLDGGFNYKLLYDVTYMATRNLNKVIDLNFYPVIEASNSNFKHRPIGIGVQGLADVFCMLMYPFESAQARQLNRDIFETIYFAAVTASKDLAKEHGFYSSYQGSPASQGILQFDMWGVTPSSRWDWASLKKEISQYGLRNSLLIAPMPTASTSQIMGSNECIEPFTRNLYVRRTSAGEFIIVNPYLAKILSKKGLWTKDIVDRIVIHGGSIQKIDEIDDITKQVFKTAYEIKCKTIIDMAADRGAFVCQSQSMNLWVEYPNHQLLNSIHFYAWKKGLKTGMYYLRSHALTKAQQFTIDPEKITKEKLKQEQVEASPSSSTTSPKTYTKNGQTFVCTDDVCISCGS
jgi:ribonucleotide reductase alpha subunit